MTDRPTRAAAGPRSSAPCRQHLAAASRSSKPARMRDHAVASSCRSPTGPSSVKNSLLARRRGRRRAAPKSPKRLCTPRAPRRRRSRSPPAAAHVVTAMRLAHAARPDPAPRTASSAATASRLSDIARSNSSIQGSSTISGRRHHERVRGRPHDHAAPGARARRPAPARRQPSGKGSRASGSRASSIAIIRWLPRTSPTIGDGASPCSARSNSGPIRRTWPHRSSCSRIRMFASAAAQGRRMARIGHAVQEARALASPPPSTISSERSVADSGW